VPVGPARISSALLAALVGLSTPAMADEPTEGDEQYFPDQYPPSGAGGATLLTGGVITVGFYGVGLGYSFLDDGNQGASDLRIPVAGPWMAIDGLGRCTLNEQPNCSVLFPTLRIALAVAVGLGQIGGLGLMLEGLLVPSAPPQGELPALPVVAPQGPSAVVAPLVTEDVLGLGVLGVF
jgi:hypothetical protein